jgi:hypothetical protein
MCVGDATTREHQPNISLWNLYGYACAVDDEAIVIVARCSIEVASRICGVGLCWYYRIFVQFFYFDV